MSEESLVKQSAAKGTAMGGAVLLVTVGVLEFLQGISAVAKDEVILVGVEYTYTLDVTAWGWIHLILGAVVAAVGIGLFTGVIWARISAPIICGLAIVANFLWLPYQPWWAITIIVLNAVVIWAVATWDPAKI